MKLCLDLMMLELHDYYYLTKYHPRRWISMEYLQFWIEAMVFMHVRTVVAWVWRSLVGVDRSFLCVSSIIPGRLMGKEKKDERDSPGESRCAISLRIRGIESVGGVAEIRKKHRREGRMRQGDTLIGGNKTQMALGDFLWSFCWFLLFALENGGGEERER